MSPALSYSKDAKVQQLVYFFIDSLCLEKKIVIFLLYLEPNTKTAFVNKSY